jgi:hypothetical protein
MPEDQRRIGVRICVALWWFWASQGHVQAGTRWFNLARDAIPDQDDPQAARILLGIGIWRMWRTNDSADSPDELERAMNMAERWSDFRTMAEAASTLGQWHENHDDLGSAAAFYERSLAWAVKGEDEATRASTLHHYASFLWERGGDHVRAAAMLEEALAISTRAGHERDIVGRRMDLADLRFAAGDAAAALTALVELVPDVIRLREPALCVEMIGSFAQILLESGDPRDGVVLGAARNRYHAEIGWPEAVLRNWEGYVEESRDALGDGEYEAARAEGRQLTMFGALEFAVRTAARHTA